jgi:hypothetical protein
MHIGVGRHAPGTGELHRLQQNVGSVAFSRRRRAILKGFCMPTQALCRDVMLHFTHKFGAPSEKAVLFRTEFRRFGLVNRSHDGEAVFKKFARIATDSCSLKSNPLGQ